MLPIGSISVKMDVVNCISKTAESNFADASKNDFLDALRIVLDYIIKQKNRKRKRLMILSQKSIGEFKGIFEKEYGKELSDAEASESAHNLVNLFDILFKCAENETKRKRRPKKEPDGFPVDGQYSCLVCGCSIDSTTGWYDKWGQKCLNCTKAVKDGVIPTFVCHDHDSYFKSWELKDKFKIHPQTARKLVRTGELKARIITNDAGKPYEYIFLKKENPHLISRYPPERKSYDRHRDKISKIRIREEKKKLKKELKLKNRR